MSSEAQEESKWLVIIPEGGLSWHLWCIDFIHNSSINHNIVVLDLRNFSLRRNQNCLTKILRKLYRVNTVDNLIKRLSTLDSVQYIKPRRDGSNDFVDEKFHLTNSISFKNGLDSEYFEEVGERVFTESQLSSGTLLLAKQVYDEVSAATYQLLKAREITRLIVPGGRTLIPAACIAIANNLGVESTILESNNSGSFGYRENPSNYRSNTDFLKSEIDSKWSNGDDAKYCAARKYLEDKLTRVNRDATNYSHSFDVIYDIQSHEVERTAVIFVTSAYEFELFVDSHTPGDLGRDHQIRMMQSFCRIAKENGYRLILRGHPPIAGRESLFAMEDRQWADFCIKNEITYLDSNSRVDSQFLMKQSSLNVVYASSAAIESVLLGSQTMILGNAEFAHLLPELCAFNENEIRNRFSNLYKESNPDQLLPYAYFMTGHGTEISEVSTTNRNSIFYDGKQVDAPRLQILAKILKKNNLNLRA